MNPVTSRIAKLKPKLGKSTMGGTAQKHGP